VVPAESYTALIGEEQRLRSILICNKRRKRSRTKMAERKKVEETLRRTKGRLGIPGTTTHGRTQAAFLTAIDLARFRAPPE